MSYKPSDAGYQAQSFANPIALASRFNVVFGDVGDNGATTGWSTYTFVASMAKVYMVHITLSYYVTASQTVYWQLLNNGSIVYTGKPASHLYTFDANHHTRISFRTPVTMAVGNNILKLQWATDGSGGTATVDTADFRLITVTG